MLFQINNRYVNINFKELVKAFWLMQSKRTVKSIRSIDLSNSHLMDRAAYIACDPKTYTPFMRNYKKRK